MNYLFVICFINHDHQLFLLIKLKRTKMSNKKPYILISNDDGYQAKGLAALISVAKNFGKLIVVSSERGESGMSHAITMKTPLRVRKIKDEENLIFYVINGTPADCIKIGMNQLVERKPDLILTGVNHGSNASISVVYSGTLGAAREGCLQQIPSIGFSLLNHDKEADFSTVIYFMTRIIEQTLKNGIEDQTFLNVNIPDIPIEEIKGIKICRQTKGVWKEEYIKRTDPNGSDYYWLTGAFDNFEPTAEDTDEWALANNYITIVPIKIDGTAYAEIDKLKNWNL